MRSFARWPIKSMQRLLQKLDRIWRSLELCRSGEYTVYKSTRFFCVPSSGYFTEYIHSICRIFLFVPNICRYEHIDLEECKIRGIRVGYTPEVLTDAVADLTMALLLATSRRLIEGNHDVHNGGWRSWQPLYMCGPGLRNSTIGLVGFGRIAQEVAKRLTPFKPKRLIYSNRSASREKEAKEIGVERVPFEQLLASSDFVILVCCGGNRIKDVCDLKVARNRWTADAFQLFQLCALTPETHHLMNARTLGLMKRTAILINCSRGLVVEQDDLYEALRTNVIRAAGLDVTTPEPLPLDSPLLTLKNCLILPHIGSAETETRLEMSRITALNILGALKNTEMVYELWCARFIEWR